MALESVICTQTVCLVRAAALVFASVEVWERPAAWRHVPARAPPLPLFLPAPGRISRTRGALRDRLFAGPCPYGIVLRVLGLMVAGLTGPLMGPPSGTSASQLQCLGNPMFRPQNPKLVYSSGIVFGWQDSPSLASASLGVSFSCRAGQQAAR